MNDKTPCTTTENLTQKRSEIGCDDLLAVSAKTLRSALAALTTQVREIENSPSFGDAGWMGETLRSGADDARKARSEITGILY